MKPEKLFELCNQLSLEDVQFIITVFAYRIQTWDGNQLMDIDTVTKNGTFLQINLTDQ